MNKVEKDIIILGPLKHHEQISLFLKDIRKLTREKNEAEDKLKKIEKNNMEFVNIPLNDESDSHAGQAHLRMDADTQNGQYRLISDCTTFSRMLLLIVLLASVIALIIILYFYFNNNQNEKLTIN